MAKTKQINVTNVPANNPVTVLSVCKRVRVGELESNAGYPTTDFKVHSPLSTDDAFHRIGGESWTFEAQNRQFFRPGDIVGYLESSIAGPVVFVQYEE